MTGANLHLHLTGSMRPATLAELAGRRGLPVPPPLRSGEVHGWPTFQRRYDAARAALRTGGDISRVVLAAPGAGPAQHAGRGARLLDGMDEDGGSVSPTGLASAMEPARRASLRRFRPVLDPNELYELADDLPDLGQPVLIQALTGFVDAGNATRLAREHLRSSLESRLIATFDVDQLIDYRSRRPTMVFVEDHWAEYTDPRLELHQLLDDSGTPFLMLSGPEPDVQWERFTAAVMALVDRLDVRLTVGLNSIPMAVPHTRPTGVTAHATRRDLITGYEPWLQRVEVPGSAGHLLEYRLGERGRDALGFAVHVPHYLAQTEYPAAAELLLSSVSRATGLLLPSDELRSAAELVRTDIDRQVAQTDDAGALVHALEEQYDAFTRGRDGSNLLAPQTGPLPTADELGAELERFLAEQGRPGDQPGS